MPLQPKPKLSLEDWLEGERAALEQRQFRGRFTQLAVQ